MVYSKNLDTYSEPDLNLMLREDKVVVFEENTGDEELDAWYQIDREYLKELDEMR